MSRFYYIGTINDNNDIEKKLYIDVSNDNLKILSLDGEKNPNTEVDLNKKFISKNVDITKINKMLRKKKMQILIRKKYCKDSDIIDKLIGVYGLISIIYIVITLTPKFNNYIGPKIVKNELQTSIENSDIKEEEIILDRINEAIKNLDFIEQEEKEKVASAYNVYYRDNYSYYDIDSLARSIYIYENLIVNYEKGKIVNLGINKIDGNSELPNISNGYKTVLNIYNETSLFHELFHSTHMTKDGHMLDELMSFSTDSKYCKGTLEYKYGVEELLVLREIVGKDFLIRNMIQRNPEAIYEKLAKISGQTKENIEKFFINYNNWYKRSYNNQEQLTLDYYEIRDEYKSIIESIDDPNIKSNFFVKNYLSQNYELINGTIYDEEIAYVNTNNTYEVVFINNENKYMAYSEILTTNAKDYLKKLYMDYYLDQLNEKDEEILKAIITICDEDVRKNINIDNFSDIAIQELKKNSVYFYDVENTLNGINYYNNTTTQNVNIDSYMYQLYKIILTKFKYKAMDGLSLVDLADLKYYLKKADESLDGYYMCYLNKTLIDSIKRYLSDEMNMLLLSPNFSWVEKDSLDYSKNEMSSLEHTKYLRYSIPKKVNIDGKVYNLYRVENSEIFKDYCVSCSLIINFADASFIYDEIETITIDNEEIQGFLIEPDINDYKFEQGPIGMITYKFQKDKEIILKK